VCSSSTSRIIPYRSRLALTSFENVSLEPRELRMDRVTCHGALADHSTPRMEVVVLQRLHYTCSTRAFLEWKRSRGHTPTSRVISWPTIFIMTAVPAPSKTPTFITSSASFRFTGFAHLRQSVRGNDTIARVKKSLTWTIVQMPNERNYRLFIFCCCLWSVPERALSRACLT